MKYYQHHIGDFDKATRHLTRIERSVYRDLIEMYYDTEQPLTLDIPALCRKVIARSNEEATAVEQVLNEFFYRTPEGWRHERCDEEIESYRANSSQKALAGKASAQARALKRQQSLNARSTDDQQPSNERATNHKPVTNNQEPVTSNQKTKPAKPSTGLSASELVAFGVDEQVANDFLAIRKAKKAPLTLTALKGIEREAAKAGYSIAQALATCAVRGWAGFNAEWVKDRPVNQTFQTKGERVAANNKAALDQWEREMTGQPPEGDFIEGEVLHG